MNEPLHLDFETKSEADIKRVGAIAYARHPSTEVLCMAYAFGDGPINVLNAAQVKKPPLDLLMLLNENAKLRRFTMAAHNAPFEYAIWKYVMTRYGYAPLEDPAMWDCTMARALMVGLPPSLEDVAVALGLPFRKDLMGRSAMLKLSKPQSWDDLGEPVWNEDPHLFAKLYPYCALDVEIERAADKKLPPLPPSEKAIWNLDLLINQRGVAVDLELSRKAAALAERLTADLNAQLRATTGGAVDKATQVAAMKRYLVSHGVAVPTKKQRGEDGKMETVETLDKNAVAGLLKDPATPAAVREAITIRSQVGKSSTAKYVKTIETACADGRVRGALQYHAAHTGRWGGRLIQPQNYPKGFDEEGQARAVGLIQGGDPDIFSLVYGDKAMDALSDALRGTIVAGPGKVLISADFNAIEARVLFWEAGDASALETYRQGGSPYLDMGAFIYKRPITKKDVKEYAVAKMTVLGAGFQMGWERFRDQCLAYGIEVSDELAQTAISAYRDKYVSVKNMWGEVERAAIAAVKTPGQHYPAMGGKILWGVSRDRQFLVCRLPSGRYLWYYKPSVRVMKTSWGEDKETLCYHGENPKTKEWCLLKTYGGALVENVTQAVARDLMANAVLNVEAADYDVVLTVHDELIAEIGEGCECGTCHWCDVRGQPSEKEYHETMLDMFLKLMCDTPTWARGLPVAAEGWVGRRYRK